MRTRRIRKKYWLPIRKTITWFVGDWKEVANSWAHPDENSYGIRLKAYVENILKRLGLDLHNLIVGNLTDDIFATALSVHTKGGKRLASFGVVTKKLLKAFDIDNEVYYADLNWKELMKAIRSVKISYKEISKFPAVKRDLALLLDKNVQFAEIEKNRLRYRKETAERSGTLRCIRR